MPRPLILSPAHDIHAAAVTWGLQRMGVDAIWSKSASLFDPAIGALGFHTDGNVGVSLQGAFSNDGIGSIWFRRARRPEQFPGAPACDTEFLSDEWDTFQHNFWALAETHPQLFWVNTPAAARKAENKLIQLNAAIDCDLRVPATLVSTDPSAVACFRKQHQRVIYKPFCPYSWLDAEGKAGHIAHARLLDPDFAVADASIRLCPGIYQSYVDKVADLRVTVIGNRYFAARVGTAVGDAFVDWRSHVDDREFLAQLCEIPEAVWLKLKALMAQLGLVFGCIDLVLDRTGELHFLEVNQGGQFLFAERWTQSQPLLQAMCMMLASGSTDYPLNPEDAAQVSYRTFCESEAYRAWSEEARAWVPSEQEVKSSLAFESK